MVHSPLYDGSLLSYEGLQVDACVAPATQERTQLQLTGTNKVCCTNFNHLAEFGDRLPSSVQEIARQRVQSKVDSLSTCCLHDLFQEAGIRGPKDLSPGKTKVLDEVCSFRLGADSDVDIRLRRFRKLQGGKADVPSGIMDQNGLYKVLACFFPLLALARRRWATYLSGL